MGHEIIHGARIVPDAGDIFWLDAESAVGHEQRGRRPFVAVTKSKFNERSKTVLVCPITSKIKDYVFHVPFSAKKLSGAVIVDQIRSIDWNSRTLEFIDCIDRETLEEIKSKLVALIDYKAV